ncbi:polyphosphate polymerase domain-containing protein [Paraclostridium tenue]
MNEVLRQEKKFLISMDQFYKYSHKLSHILQVDKHSKDEGYEIRSLYFDSIDDRDFQEKEDGIEIRRKIRLRNYGSNSTFAMLEMKQKQGDLQKKRSLRMEKVDAMRLIDGDYSVLLQYSEPFALECYAIMNMHCYRPKTVVTYKRKAFVAKENNIRITFDHNIVANESYYDIFSVDLSQNAVIDPYVVVLEVKYNGFLLSYIKDMLMECDKSKTSVSKYCLGRSISKHYVF